MKEKEQLIDARTLKSVLANKSDFSTWTKRRIKSNGLVENKDFFINVEKIKALKNNSLRTNYFFTYEAATQIILNHKKNKIAKNIREELNKKNLEALLAETIKRKREEISIIKITDKEYPKQLKTIKNPPQQLYIKGNIENFKKHGIAVIGTRDCSNYGRQICRKFTKGIAAYNLNIISGLAKGIDTCAHKACLEVKGKTIAVLPSGLNNVYPKQNEELLNKIIEKGGTVISEYPPDFEKTSESCKERNRIVSALAIGTLVIEAEKRSGTSTTVNYMNEQGKKAFCIPSSILNSKGIGTNQMIKEGIAKIVTEVEDIIKEYPELKLEKLPDFEIDNQKTKKQTKSKKKKEKIEIDEENLEIYNLLSKEPKHIDEISKLLNQPIHEITYKLTMLELEGVIEELPGKKFKIKEERN